MTDFPVVDTVSAVLVAAVLVGWLTLVARRYCELGPMERIKNRGWFVDTFEQGLGIIRRCPWLLPLLLLAVLVSYAESQVRSYIYLQKHPALLENVAEFYQRRASFSSSIRASMRFLPFDLLGKAGQLNGAMLEGFHSGVVVAVFLVGVMAVLLRAAPAGNQTVPVDSGLRNRKLLGIAAGVAALIPILREVWFIHADPKVWPFWILLPVSLAGMLLYAFVYSTFLPAMETAGRGGTLSFAGALSQVDNHLRALFLFILFEAAVGTASTLTLLVASFTGNPASSGSLWRYTQGAVNILFAMICFVSVIIVVRRETVVSAFNHCINLWARHAKTAAAFVIIGAVMLLIPEILQRALHTVFPYQGWKGWEIYVLRFVLSLLKVAAGVLVMSSMVVFYKKIQESEEGRP